MKKQFLIFLLLIFFALPVFAQKKEARKSAGFGLIPCSYFNALVSSAYEEYKQSPDSNIYVIYYEAKHREVFARNKKTKTEEKKVVNPRFGNALNRAREVPLYLETNYKLPPNKVVLIEGGFRENLEIEIWIVPKDAEPPKPSPTVDAKDVKFEKGKPLIIRDCAREYDGYK